MIKSVLLFLGITYICAFLLLFVFNYTQHIYINLILVLYILVFIFVAGFTIVSLFFWIDAYRKIHALNKYIWSKRIKRGILALFLIFVSYIVLAAVIELFTISYVHPPYPYPPETYQYDRTLN